MSTVPDDDGDGKGVGAYRELDRELMLSIAAMRVSFVRLKGAAAAAR